MTRPGPQPAPRLGLPAPHPAPHLGVQEGLHRQKLHQPLLNEAQEEAYVPVAHVCLDPQKVVDDGAVTLGPREELLNICG